MNIYVASSCSNRDIQHKVVHGLRKDKHEVYDFFHPSKGVLGFSWDELVRVARTGFESAYAPGEVKERLLSSFETEVAEIG